MYRFEKCCYEHRNALNCYGYIATVLQCIDFLIRAPIQLQDCRVLACLFAYCCRIACRFLRCSCHCCWFRFLLCEHLELSGFLRLLHERIRRATVSRDTHAAQVTLASALILSRFSRLSLLNSSICSGGGSSMI